MDEMQVVRYERPEVEHGKGHVWLGRTDIITAGIQVVKEGGETNLHAHTGQDAFWLVLGGRARFYSDEQTVAAEIGPNEGIIIPRGVKYWFESASEEPLEILRVAAIAQKEQDQRVNYNPLRERQKDRHEGSVDAFAKTG